MTHYTVVTMGGRLLARTHDGDAAYRMAHRIADETDRYVELHYLGGDPHVVYVYPARCVVPA